VIGIDDWNAAYEYLAADIDAVEQELGWDCSDWRRPPAPKNDDKQNA